MHSISPKLRSLLSPAQLETWKYANLSALRDGMSAAGAIDHAFAQLYTVYPLLASRVPVTLAVELRGGAR